MNSVAEALNTLISAVNVAHNKGGVYSMEETYHIYTAISYLNSLQKTPSEQETSAAPTAPQYQEEPMTDESIDPNIEQQGY